MNRSMLILRIDSLHYPLITELTLKANLLNANQKLESKEKGKELSDTRNTLYQIVKDTKRGVKKEIINEKDIGKAITILDKYSITPFS